MVPGALRSTATSRSSVTSLPVRIFHLLAVLGARISAVAGGQVEDGGIGRIVIERDEKGMIVAAMLPARRGRFREEAAGRQFGAHDIFFGAGHAGIEGVLGVQSGNAREQQDQDNRNRRTLTPVTLPNHFAVNIGMRRSIPLCR